MRHRLSLGLLFAVALTGVGCQGTPSPFIACNLALINGTLVADGENLALESPSGHLVAVTWPDGIHASRVDGVMRLIGFFGQTIAREGDYVEMGGGAGADGVFEGCGDISVTSPSS